jgi:hypothetical protein
MYILIDLAWVVGSVVTDYLHDKEETHDDVVESLEQKAEIYNLDYRVTALEEKKTLKTEEKPPLELPRPDNSKTGIFVFYLNAALCSTAFVFSWLAEENNANDIIFFLSFLCLFSTAYDTIGIIDYKTDDELADIEEESEQLWTVAADDFIEKLPRWMRNYAYSMTVQTAAAIENYEISGSSLKRALQITQFRNQNDYSKDKLDDPEAALVRVVSAADGSLRRRAALKF